MQVVPVIITYPDTPFDVPIEASFAAANLVEDMTRVTNRVTKKAMQFTRNTLVLKANFNMDPNVKLSLRSTSESWWDAWRVLRANGLDEGDDIYVVYHANNLRDWSGIGMPAAPHAYDGDLVNDVDIPWDPDVGGIAVNGYGQLQTAMDTDFSGTEYLKSLMYTIHETWHAMGRHHVPSSTPPYRPNPYDHVNQWESLMGYAYNAAAAGDLRFSPMLALPEEIVTLRHHSVNHEIPDRQNDKEPGWADDFVLTRREDLELVLPHLSVEHRQRLMFGELRGD